MFGVLRVLAPEAESGRPAQGQWLPETNFVLPVVQTSTTLGSDLHNSVVLFDSDVAPEHASLDNQRGRWSITNCAENAPLYIDGTAITRGVATPIESGQLIRIGTATLQLVAPSSTYMRARNKLRLTTSSFSSKVLLQPHFNIKRSLSNWRWLALVGMIFIFAALFAVLINAFSNLFIHTTVAGASGSLLAAFTIPLIPVAGVVAIVALIDRYERRSWYYLVGSFLWGMIIAIPAARLIDGTPALASIFNLSVLPSLFYDVVKNALIALGVGFTEEIVKGIGLLILMYIMRARFENRADGILYGAVIGAGFALIENVLFFARTDSYSTILFLTLGRVVLGWLGHSTFTAFIGAALGTAREKGLSGWRFAWRGTQGFAIAILLHTIFDTITLQANDAIRHTPGSIIVMILAIVAIILNYVLLLALQGILYIMLMRTLARESAILREYLADEVQQGTVLPEEYVVLQRASLQQRLQRSLLMSQDIEGWRALKKLYTSEVLLAFTKWHAAHQHTAIQEIDQIDAIRDHIHYYRRIVAQHEAAEAAHFTPTATG